MIKYNLIVYDVIGIPDISIDIKAQLFRFIYFLKIPAINQKITFFLDNNLIGESLTQFNGIATINFKLEKTGVFPLLAKYRYNKDTEFISTAKIYCSDKKRKSIIVDIDNTISDSSWITILFKPNIMIKPLPNAAISLQKLSKKFDIIYLTRRTDSLLIKTRDWLKINGFPDAPIFSWNIWIHPFRASIYKTESIKRLKNYWNNIHIGIGDKKSDNIAYIKNNMLSLILTKDNSKKNKKGLYHYVSDWNEIVDFLLTNDKE